VCCISFGVLLLLHSCYSTIEYREFKSLLQQKDTVPVEIVGECLIGCLLCCWGAVEAVGKFQTIKASSLWTNRSFDSVNNRPNFVCLNRRGGFFSK